MSAQLSLFAVLVASPICVYQKPCQRKGRAELGEPIPSQGCVNRAIRCGAQGVSSTRTDLA